MELIIERLPEETLEDFADKHDLTMKVVERKTTQYGEKFYASFVGVEIKEGEILRGAFGNGEIPDEAIANYAREISHKHLVKDAMRTWRKEIIAPKLIYFGSNGKHDK